MSKSIVSSVIAIPTFFAGWAIMLWLGICLLVPQHPFTKRDIASGVCLIVFSVFIGFAGGIITYVISYVCCWLVKKCCSCNKEKCIDGIC